MDEEKIIRLDGKEKIIPLDGGFHITAYNPESVKGRIIDLLNKQTKKGVEKYGHTLDDCPDSKFDWRLMAMEEMIDLVQYQQKEIIRLERLLNPNE